LLKIITGTLDKTAGEVEINGRVSSILELGTGFSPEITGRENMIMGGLMMGMSREEILQKMDWIIEFSELEDFIDQPFRTYSSGMQARLTFSTAICVEPEILIVDEALSVGDIKFQNKCFVYMQGLRNRGCTILLVTHDLNSVKAFCDQAILFEKGEIIRRGMAKEVADFFYKMMFSAVNELASGDVHKGQESERIQVAQQDSAQGDIFKLRERAIERFRLKDIGASEWGNRKAEIVSLGILDMDGHETAVLESGKEYDIFCYAVFYESIEEVLIGCIIRNEKGVDLFRMNSVYQQVPIPPQERGSLLEIRIRLAMWLAPGDYWLTMGVVDNRADAETRVLDGRLDAHHFKVTGDCRFDAPTVVNLQPRWMWESYDLAGGDNARALDDVEKMKRM
ncbi:ABC transporter ATP-binding protein, partial [Candidatus Parcubacteria bacterium]